MISIIITMLLAGTFTGVAIGIAIGLNSPKRVEVIEVPAHMVNGSQRVSAFLLALIVLPSSLAMYDLVLQWVFAVAGLGFGVVALWPRR